MTVITGNRPFWRIVGLSLALLVLGVAVQAVATAAEDTWLLVDTGERRLSVMRGDVVLQAYDNISIGRSGTTWNKRRHDGKTPLGEFHIVRISSDTPFHRFIALDYPDAERARRALQAGILGKEQYAAIRRAQRRQQLPPQNTVLGGSIGIHGIGKGNAAVHRDFNWTYGCIALTNEQIDDLSHRVYPGMRVIIRR